MKTRCDFVCMSMDVYLVKECIFDRVKQKSSQRRCKLTSREINLSFFRDEYDLENVFWFMDIYSLISGYYLSLLVCYGLMSILFKPKIIAVLIISCFFLSFVDPQFCPLPLACILGVSLAPNFCMSRPWSPCWA